MFSLLLIGLAASAMDATPTPEAPASTPPAAVAHAAPAAPAVDDGDKMVCKSEAPTGTRFKTRRCLTKRQWAQIEYNARESTDKLEMGGLRGH